MRVFEVRIRSYDRREGKTNWWTTKLDATSAPAAIAKVARGYMNGLTRKQKRDAAKLMEVQCTALAEKPVPVLLSGVSTERST
jgi:hypothetical protein